MLRSVYRELLTVLALIVAIPAIAKGQVVITQVNDEGAKAPCIGIGLGVLLEKRCVDTFARAGFLRHNEAGDSGLTIGTSGVQDGQVTAVRDGSPAAAGGVVAGDLLVAVNDVPVQPPPVESAQQLMFGRRDETVKITVLHAGATREMELKRMPAEAPDAPGKPGMMLALRPLIDWRGKYVPCISVAGPTGLAGLAICENMFKKDGYIRVSELGTTGLVLDAKGTDKAVVASLTANSPAAAQGVVAGDEIVAVNGKPLKTSAGVKANIALFGKVGEKRTVTVQHGGEVRKVELALVALPN